MKHFVGCAIVVVAAVFATALAEADAGYFIPKAFYTLDAEGHKTQPHPLSPDTTQYLRRLRRQVFSSSSSSASSSVSSSNGGPVVFSTQNTVSHTPAGTTSFSSRFGDDGSASTSAHSSSSVGANVNGAGYGGNYAGVQYPTVGSSHGATTAGLGTGAYNNYNTGSASSVPLASRFGTSSSSSSSVSSNGGPVYFKTEQSVSHTPTSNINLASRFGEDTPQTVSKTVSTSGYIDETGVHSKTTTTNH
ncbi:dachshund homolog 1 [Anastrepha ludens]|uniref:dachshund homolog 1 n=1 Tax=Anastrepha ludens TaxID=28586 RepID=UPI0023AF642C|nr:dachshund homolog 1 [Anastrepha ludens]